MEGKTPYKLIPETSTIHIKKKTFLAHIFPVYDSAWFCQSYTYRRSYHINDHKTL